jgi:hypothetical protein
VCVCVSVSVCVVTLDYCKFRYKTNLAPQLTAAVSRAQQSIGRLCLLHTSDMMENCGHGTPALGLKQCSAGNEQ